MTKKKRMNWFKFYLLFVAISVLLTFISECYADDGIVMNEEMLRPALTNYLPNQSQSIYLERLTPRSQRSTEIVVAYRANGEQQSSRRRSALKSSDKESRQSMSFSALANRVRKK